MSLQSAISGNTVADETAKITNKQDITAMISITENIDHHCRRQQSVLVAIYRYLLDLNALHSKMCLEKD